MTTHRPDAAPADRSPQPPLPTAPFSTAPRLTAWRRFQARAAVALVLAARRFDPPTNSVGQPAGASVDDHSAARHAPRLLSSC